MNAVEILKQAVKDKSWPMVRLALKQMETEGVEQIEPTIQSVAPQVKQRVNLFSDDGKKTTVKAHTITRDGIKVGRTIELDPALEDKKFNSGKAAPRERAPHKPKYLTCIKCQRKVEVDGSTYKYYTLKQEGEAPPEYNCGEC